MSDAAEFLERLWGDGFHSLCARRPGGQFRFVAVDATPGELLARAGDLDGEDVWFGLHGMGAAPERRGGDADVTSVVALAADLDWHDPDRHKGADLPSEDEVRTRVRTLGSELTPLIVVETGGGLQCYWPLTVDVGPDDGAALQAALDAQLATVGLVNERGDLASVLRLPGTFNMKAEPVEVVIAAFRPGGYTPEYLRKRLPSVTARARSRAHGGGYVNDLAAIHAALDAAGRHQDLEALIALGKHHGAHSPFLATDGGLYVTRPGKPAGTSASIGNVAPGVVKVFSGAWPPFRQNGRYTADEIIDLAREDRSARGDAPPHTDDDAPADEERRRSSRNLPEEFWTARPELDRIRTAAHARARSADAVLGAVLARVSMLTPPTLRVDTGVVIPAPVNTYVGLVAQSGGGKTSAAAVARDLVPIERDDLVVDMPLGSGEGAVELFYEWQLEDQPDGKRTKVKRRTRTGVLLTLDEGQALTELGGRNGAVLLPVLRTAWSGETVGMTNAREETKRRLEAHTYRLSFIVGFQAAAAGALLADQERGTAQRFVLFSTVDPTIPDASPRWPTEPVLDQVPPTIPGQMITVDPAVAAEIRLRALQVARGELVLDPLDAHRDQSRARVGALLAVLAGRQGVTVDDWRLAGMILDTSDAVRRWVLDTNATVENELEDARTRAAIKRQRLAAKALDDDVHTRAVIGGARAMARVAHRQPGETVTRRDLSRATAGKHRHEADPDEMIAYAEQMTWIRADGDGWVAGAARPA